MGDHLGRIYLNCQGIYSDRLYCFRIFDAQDRLFDLFCYTGETSRLWRASILLSANPDSLSELCGFHINHRSRSFLLKVSGVSSHLSFCCTSLVSGFIIQEDAQFVYSQSAQQIRHTLHQKSKFLGYMNSVLPVYCSTFPAKALPRRSYRAIADTAPAY